MNMHIPGRHVKLFWLLQRNPPHSLPPPCPHSPCPHTPHPHVLPTWHNSLAGEHRLCDLWLCLFSGGDPTIQKELCFLGMHWIASLFSQEAVLCVHFVFKPHLQLTQAKRYCKEFTFELFWTIFWQELKCSKLGATFHTRRIGITWLTGLSASSPLTSLAAGKDTIARS